MKRFHVLPLPELTFDGEPVALDGMLLGRLIWRCVGHLTPEGDTQTTTVSTTGSFALAPARHQWLTPDGREEGTADVMLAEFCRVDWHVLVLLTETDMRVAILDPGELFDLAFRGGKVRRVLTPATTRHLFSEVQ